MKERKKGSLPFCNMSSTRIWSKRSFSRDAWLQFTHSNNTHFFKNKEKEPSLVSGELRHECEKSEGMHARLKGMDNYALIEWFSI